MTDQLKLVYYVPDSHLEVTKQAVFDAGAGQMDMYQQCCWQTKGVGQFRPLSSAQPFIGEIGTLCHVDEWRVELLVPSACAKAVQHALITAHPYEIIPAYEFYVLVIV